MPVLSTLAPTPPVPSTASNQAVSPRTPEVAAATLALPTEILRQIFRIAQIADQNGIDTYHHQFTTALKVSHISRRWNAVALGQPELWASISITRSIGQSQDVDALHDILARSRPCNISFEISYRQRSTDAEANLSQVSAVDNADTDSEFEFWKMVLRPGTNAGKYATFRRFKLLYLWGAHDEIHSVLRACARYSELASLARLNPLPIKYLKVMVSRRKGTQLIPNSVEVVRPLSVCRISSQITDLRSRGIRFFEYPQWAMDRIVLEGVEIDTKLIRILVAETGVRRLTLRGVTIPIWIDIDSAHPSALSLWYSHRDMDTRLEHVELNALVKHPKCTRNLEAHGETAFTLFYEDVFIPKTLKQLKSLKLVDLCRVAWESLLGVLHPGGGQADFVFEAVETIDLRDIHREQAEEEIRSCIPTNFPHLRMFNSLPVGDGQP